MLARNKIWEKVMLFLITLGVIFFSAAIAVADWRNWLLRNALIRAMWNITQIDVVFAANMRYKKDIRNFRGLLKSKSGHFNGPRYWVKGICGRTRALEILASELAAKDTALAATKKARGQYIDAVEWAKKRNVRVILSAASLKGIFGDNAKKLKEMFPDILFTKGDNGTAIIQLKEIFHSFSKTGLTPENSRIAIVCPYNTLGGIVLRALLMKGYKIVGIGKSNKAMAKVARESGIKIVPSYEKMGKVDAIIGCSHSEETSLTASRVDKIRHNGKKLLVLDVGQPEYASIDEFLKYKDKVVRLSTGNGFSPHLSYVLGSLIAKRFGFGSPHMTFGCFAEALALSYALKHNDQRFGDLRKINWFDTNEDNMKIIEVLFEDLGFTNPDPSWCFTRTVKSFDLNLSVEATAESVVKEIPAVKFPIKWLNKLASLL